MTSENYFNRELSWLQFNRRVLYLAMKRETPLLEKVRFLSIYSSNLDEFFMKRVGNLKRAIASGKTSVGNDQADPTELLEEIRKQILELNAVQTDFYESKLIPELLAEGIELVKWNELTKSEKSFASDYFKEKVFPVLTPLAVDPAHPFPFLSNLSVSLGIELLHPETQDHHFARIKIPDMLPSWVLVNPGKTAAGLRFFRLIDLISQHLMEIFPQMKIENITAFRVTRAAETEVLKDDVQDLMDEVEEELRQRRTADIVRLEHLKTKDDHVIDLLQEELELEEEDFYQVRGELDYRTLYEIARLNIPRLKYPKWNPVTQPPLSDENASIFKLIRTQDILVHHPFDSFHSSIERLIRQASEDPKVLAIKITLYRVGDDSPLIPLLIRAAEKGKQVVCVVELKASFEEEQNIYWGETLEKAGVHVVYGVVGLKTHSKIALVVRKEQDDYRFYGHIGTGNYNHQTAKLYTDLSLFTCDRAITSEIIEIFNYLTGPSLPKNYKKFLVAPVNMRRGFLDLIAKEAKAAGKGHEAEIMAKMNSLEDQEICDALYEASKAGVKIRLIVRGLCSLRPGVKKLSQNIEVTSILGRFLEHSRIFYFRNGAKKREEGKFFIGSADWMYRNLNNRVEATVPIEDKNLKKECLFLLDEILNDRVQTWELKSDGTYELRSPSKSDKGIGIQERLVDRARSKATNEYSP